MSLFGFGKPKIRRPAFGLFFRRLRDGGRVSFFFDAIAAAEPVHQGYAACRRIRIFVPRERLGTEGAFDAKEGKRLDEREDALLAMLEDRHVRCLLVGRLKHPAFVEHVFQVEDATAFDAALEHWREMTPETTRVLAEEGWTYFDKNIRPNAADEEWMRNSQVVLALRKAGSRPGAEHVLEHVFVGPPRALDGVFDAIVKLELGTPRARAAGVEELVVEQRSPLYVDAITERTLRFGALARAHGALYDGWGAEIVR